MSDLTIIHGSTVTLEYEYVSGEITDLTGYILKFQVYEEGDDPFAEALMEQEAAFDPLTNLATIVLTADDWLLITNETQVLWYGTRVYKDEDHDYPDLQGKFNVTQAIAKNE